MSQPQSQFLRITDLQTDGNGMKFSVAGRMAAVITACKKKNGACLPQDLNAEGFTPDEVATHWEAAHFLIGINNFDGSGAKDHGS